MRLDRYVRDYNSFVDELAEVIRRPTTRIYLDTSLLMWLIRLGARARTEFLEWAKARPSGTVRVPVWCAHELHTHVVRQSLNKTLNSVAADVESKYLEFARLAAERADDEACRRQGFSGRDAFVSEVSSAVAKIKRMALVVKDEANLAGSADEIITFINDHVLETDLTSIVQEVSQVGEFRYSHLMPPGFHDKKPEDRFGDLIIWREIAKDMPAAQEGDTGRPSAVFVSRDDKTDWVSSAPRVNDPGDKVTKPNRDSGLDVTLSHPLLEHEFAALTGGCSIHVVQPAVLATIITAADPVAGPLIRTWLSAAYRPDTVDNVIRLIDKGRAARAAVLEDAEKPSTGQSDQAVAEAEQIFTSPTLNELLAPEVRQVVAATMQSPTEQQAVAAAGWLKDAVEGRMTPIDLGRRLAAWHHEANRTTELASLIEATKGRLELNQLRATVLAIAAYAYLEDTDRFRRPPLVKLVNSLIAISKDEAFAPAFTALKGLLDLAGGNLLHVPGTRPGPNFQLDLQEGSEAKARRLRGIRIDGQDVLIETEFPGDTDAVTLTSLIGEQQCSGLELLLAVAGHYGIDADAMTTSDGKKKLRWSEHARLAELDPEAPGGISPLEPGV